MYLLISQLVYTSFAGKGFMTLASGHVPAAIQEAFKRRIVSQYWDSYNPPAPGYGAVYFYQMTPKHNLFGWLYHDGEDDMGRSDVPYFVCYYLADSLSERLLASLFTCLEKGPVGLIDRHSPTVYLETDMISNFWSYQPARPGVTIPWHVRQRNYATLREGELINLFLTNLEQETLNDLQEQTYEQQVAYSSSYSSYIIDSLNIDATNTAPENKVAISNTSIQTYQSVRQKLQLHKLFLGTKNQRTYSNRINTRSSLTQEKNIDLVRNWIKLQTSSFGESDSYSFRERNSSDPFYLPDASQNLRRSVNYQSNILSYKNSQLLLKVGVAVTFLALGFAIYGLQQASLFDSSHQELISWASPSVVYETLAEVPNVPQGLFKYGGSTSFAPLRSQAIVTAIAQAYPQFKLLYIAPAENKHDSGVGIDMLIAGELSFAQSSRQLKDSELAQARQLGFTLEQIPVAVDGIAFYVNSQIDIPGLTLSQIKDIFTGKIINWKQVGGSDLPITPISRDPQFSGTAEFIEGKVLEGKEFSRSVQQVATTTESIRLVAETPGGISYATASEVIGQSVDPVSLASIHPLSLSTTNKQAFVSPFVGNNRTVINKAVFVNGSYPLTRQMFVIVKRDGGIDEKAGMAYASLFFSQEGQHMIERAGFVPIR